MALRAGIVVTGTEVLTGRVTDRNGPWLAQQLLEAGVDVGRVLIVGDRAGDLRAALAHLYTDHDLIITTGGLGPTADDITAALVADFQGRPLRLDGDLQDRITAIVDRLQARHGLAIDPQARAEGVRKQATVPRGAVVLEPVGTAPGLIVPAGEGLTGPPVLVLPGPPGELRLMWPTALAHPALRVVLDRATDLRESTIRMWRTSEPDLAATLRRVAGQVHDLEISTCLRDGEVEVVSRYAPQAQREHDALRRALSEDFGDRLFSDDGSTVDDLIATGMQERGWTVATAESCTGGMLVARLTERPGSSAFVRGALVVYDNAVKSSLAGVDAELLSARGAVSREVAEALAAGARRALGADVGVGITGIAGPDGGTEAKPVGTVHLCVVTPQTSRHVELHLPGDRDGVRRRSVLAAMHEIRLALAADRAQSSPHASAIAAAN